MSVIIKLLSKFDDSGLRKAKSGFSGLGKALGAVGIGLGLNAITDTLMDAAKAAAADAKSTKLLNIQLVRNAGATKASLKENDKFIESLSLQTGIMDDDLRPSMAKFGNVTKNVKDAQKLLKITLDGAAGSGKNQEKIANAVAKAYAGNTTSLKKMFPELMKSKDVLGDFAKTYEGLAVANADPFMKFNNSMDILKEKLGVIVLPLIISAIDEISKPGGLIETVGKFLEDVSNPKTETGQAFVQVKDTVTGLSETVVNLGTIISNLFSLDVNGMPLMNDLKSFFDLVKDVTNGLNQAGDALDDLMGKSKSLPGADGKDGKPVVSQPNAFERAGKSFLQFTNPLLNIGGLYSDLKRNFGGTPTNNVVINVPSADPKAVVDAVSKYLKQNGSLPFTGKAGR